MRIRVQKVAIRLWLWQWMFYIALVAVFLGQSPGRAVNNFLIDVERRARAAMP